MARILIAEDVADIAQVLRIGLEREGFTVVIAHDGNTALSRALDGDIDLAILDIRMPGLDGMAVLREVRAIPTLQQYPIIMLTANITQEEMADGFAAGADAYIIKPFRISAVATKIRELLAT